MEYRLLVDLEAIELLYRLPKRTRTRLLDQLEKIRASPDDHSQAYRRGSTGRRIEVNVFAGYEIHYWIDFPTAM